MLTARCARATVPLAAAAGAAGDALLRAARRRSELRVRVYPDKIHLDAHEPELTADEHAWGAHYWQQDWRAGSDDARARPPGSSSPTASARARAAWIARVLQPTNVAQRPRADRRRTAAAGAPAFPPSGRADGEDAAGGARRRRACCRIAGSPSLHSGGRPRRGRRPARHPGRSPSVPIRRRRAAHRRPGDAAARSTPACAGWSTSTPPKRPAWRCACTIPPRVCGAGIDSLLVFGVARLARRRRDGRRAWPTCSTRTTTPTASSSCALGTPTNNTDDARAGYDADDPGAPPQLRGRSRAPTPRRSTPPATRPARHARSGCRPSASRRRSGRVGAADGTHELDAAQHERRAVAGRLGLLPRQHDRLRRHRPRRPRRVDWARGHFVRPRARAAARCRRCAAAASPTACCR